MADQFYASCSGVRIILWHAVVSALREREGERDRDVHGEREPLGMVYEEHDLVCRVGWILMWILGGCFWSQ